MDSVPARSRKAAVTPERQRPADRREQIIAAAREEFYVADFHTVTMGGIARKVGITAGALYRHFPSKQELLGQVVLRNVGELADALDSLGPEATAEQMSAAVLGLMTRRQGSRVLFQDEHRNLPEDRLAEINGRARQLTDALTAAVARARPELSAADARLLAWALLAVAMSPVRHRVSLRQSRMAEVLADCCTRLVTTSQLPAHPRAATEPAPPALSSGQRREIVLSAATSLFSEYGYQSVSMEQIADAAELAPSSLYNHFPSKAAILVAALVSGSEALRRGVSDAHERAATPSEALGMIVTSYVGNMSRPGNVIGLLGTELRYLPPDVQHDMRRRQRDHVDEWASLLPLPLNEGRVVAHAAIELINNLLRIGRVRARPGFPDDIIGLARNVLAVGQEPRS
jgi:AcrR family transcriptional regulator